MTEVADELLDIAHRLARLAVALRGGEKLAPAPPLAPVLRLPRNRARSRQEPTITERVHAYLVQRNRVPATTADVHDGIGKRCARNTVDVALHDLISRKLAERVGRGLYVATEGK